jgi:lipoprotein-anchoring transpeptidase ErfK/SrfK
MSHEEAGVLGDLGGVPADGAVTVRQRRRSFRRSAVLGAVAAALLLSTGCQSTDHTPAAQAAANAVEDRTSAAKIVFQPATSAMDVRPDAAVSVSVTDGELTSVNLVDDKSRSVPGTLAADGSSWTATAPLRVARQYRASATAVDADGRTVDATAFFATLKPKKVLETSISPLSGSTVGVGMPIVVRFNKAVKDRAAVEGGLAVQSKKLIEGSWSWISDTEVHYRPKTYWPANNRVTLDVQLRGVEAARDLWGMKNRTIKFSTASSMVSVVNVPRHTLTVYRNGKRARTIPVSTGKAGFLTRNGTKVVLEKHTLKVMDATTIGIGKSDPEYYRLDVPYALRVTWSGEFVHAAPWSTGSQGRANVSHGCVGMGMSNAIWLFNNTHVGDVIKVVGSPRTLEPGNGYTDWNVSWDKWLEGSALSS